MRGPESTQLTLPLARTPAESDIEVMSVGGRTVRVRLVRNLRARHYLLRAGAGGEVRLTIPRGGTREEARAFLRRELGWIDSQRYAAARNEATIRLRGVVLPLTVENTPEGRSVTFGSHRAAVRPGETARAAACRHVRELARAELAPRLLELAGSFSLRVTRVTIRDQQTRWGSCAHGGAISLNWRLIQMPDAVRDYVLVHELMHLREGGHGRRFWRLVEDACPDHRAARRWLKEHERELL